MAEKKCKKKQYEEKNTIALEKKEKTNKIVFLYLSVLIALIFIGFYNLHNDSFVRLDDDWMVYDNEKIKEGLNLKNIKWAFSSDSLKLGFYFPLTIISHLTDVSLYGLNPFYHHLTSLIIHTFNAILLFFMLVNSTRDHLKSFLISLLFAIHPLHVESVAWISERKDVLSSFFALLSLLFYVYYSKKPSIKRYIPVFLFYLCGLLSKTMVITLPFVMLLMDYWPLKRIDFESKSFLKKFKYLLVEKIPMLLLIPIFSYLTILAQEKATALLPLENLSLDKRIFNAVISYIRYLYKMVYPEGLTALYPLNPNDLKTHIFIFSLLILLTLTILAIIYARKFPFLFFGWFLYFGMLIPVIGIVQVGIQCCADRYTYLSLIGIFIVVVYFSFEIAKRNKFLKLFLIVVAPVVFLTLTFLTSKQVLVWKDSETLFRHTLKHTKGNWLIDNNYAAILMEKGNFDEAVFHLKRAMESNPRFENIYINLSLIYSNLQKYSEGADYAKKALEISPNSDKALTNFGLALNGMGNFSEAITNLKKAIEINPLNLEAILNLGNAYLYTGKLELAKEMYLKAAEKQEQKFKAINNLGIVFLQEKNFEKAAECFSQAIKLEPSFPDSHINLGYTLIELNRPYEAIKELETALSIDPNSKIAQGNLERAKKMVQSR